MERFVAGDRKCERRADWSLRYERDSRRRRPAGSV